MTSSTRPVTRLPYAQATSVQQGLALADLLGALRDHFPTLALPVWCARLEQVRPDLLVYGEREVHLDPEDIARLAQSLATEPGLPVLDPPVYRNEAYYLARRLVYCQGWASRVLAELEANPTAYGPGVCELVFSLAAGNDIAQEVYRRTHPPLVRRPGQPDPAAAQWVVPARIQAVRLARGERFTPYPFPDDHRSSAAA